RGGRGRWGGSDPGEGWRAPAPVEERGAGGAGTMSSATFRIWRGDGSGGDFREYKTEISEGMVVLDAVHQIQAHQANDLAVRWNCKAGKCGSCSAEINGRPRLMCMTRMNSLPGNQAITAEPMGTFPLIKALVRDFWWTFRATQG